MEHSFRGDQTKDIIEPCIDSGMSLVQAVRCPSLERVGWSSKKERMRSEKGIYNYCDRWCERCFFINPCLNFAMSEERPSDPEAHPTLFWEKVSETLQGNPGQNCP
jgi:hypothetical protein